MEPTSRIEIDLPAIERNVAAIRRAVSADAGREVGICSVLKADAYSLGAPRIAKRLEIAAVQMMAVFTPDQARALVEAAIRTPLLILMPIRAIQRTDPLYRALVEGRLHLTVHDTDQLEDLIRHADRFGVVIPIHVEVNTGMNRAGAAPDEAERLVKRIISHPRLALAGLSTHFASADTDESFTLQQHQRFTDWLARIRPIIPATCVIHEAATYATFRTPAVHADMVRVGLALLGYAAEEIADPERCALINHAKDLSPAVRWLSRVVHTARIPAGESVGYGAAWRAKRPTRLALIPVGYADGYPLALSSKGAVGVELPDGSIAHAPVVGRVSMDQITVDVTDLPESAVVHDTPVELIGQDKSAPNHLPTLARAAGTITHELLCRLSPRIQRTYKALDLTPPALRAGAAAPV